MKLSLTALSIFFVNNVSTKVAQAFDCYPDPLEFSETMALKVEKVGSVPAINTAAFSYNMSPMDNFDGTTIFFIDQNNGIIYSFDSATDETKTVFDMKSSHIPDGLTLDWTYGGAGQTYRVKSMTQGASSDEIIAVFTSSTLPPGWSEADATLPAPEAYGQWVCDEEPVWIPDIYRPGVLPDCFDSGAGLPTFTGYDVFVKYTMVNGELENPMPFFVSETAVLVGHLGGGIATLDDGMILWSLGDCTIFGIDGAYAPQLDHESCGKIILIDSKAKGEFSIAVKGVRNSQQMRVFSDDKKKTKGAKGGKAPKSNVTRNLKSSKKAKKSKNDKYVAWMEIGGVTAEEVNAISLDKILDSHIYNYGWGRNMYDGKAREGTFYVNAGIGGVLGTQPSCKENAPAGEPGYVQPWIQFGRTPTDFFYGISSLAIPTAGNDKLNLLWSEFNTGKILGTDKKFVEGASPATSYKIKIFDADGVYLENGLNDLVKAELGEVGFYRGDPRLFHYPDGQAGVFIERTGVFYKLTEIAL